jgi:uncharacterized membrane protein (UPF0127 family)
MTTPLRLLRADTGDVVVQNLEVADGPWSRFRGLQLRRRLPPGSGLLLVPCPSVHTFFMRFPIDVLLLDRGGVLLAVRREVRPWRVVLPVHGAYATLELPAGSADVEAGVALRLEAAEQEPPPRSLSFLRSSSIVR